MARVTIGFALELRFGDRSLQIFNVNKLTVNDSAPHYRQPVDWSILFRPRHWNSSIVGAQSEQASLNEANRCVFRGAQSYCTLCHGIEYGLISVGVLAMTPRISSSPFAAPAIP